MAPTDRRRRPPSSRRARRTSTCASAEPRGAHMPATARRDAVHDVGRARRPARHGDRRRRRARTDRRGGADGAPGAAAATRTRTSGSTSSGPSREQVEEVGAVLGLHPLIVEDVLEGNQRAKIETTDGVVHIVLFALTYDDEARRDRARHRPGPGLPADRPRRRRGSRAATPHLRVRHRADPASTARTTCCGRSPTTSSTATSRSPTSSATPSTRSRTRSSARPRKETLEQLFELKRELIDVRRSISPVREVFNQLTNRDVAAHRRRRARSTSATSTTT